MAIRRRDFREFILRVEECLEEFKLYVSWDLSKEGIIHDIEVHDKTLKSEAKELKDDDLFLIHKLNKALRYAHDQSELAFVLFERFKMRRNEHIYYENELDVIAHTVDILNREI